MNVIYEENGLLFWNQREIEYRNNAVTLITSELSRCLRKINNAFQFYQCEAPILTPIDFISTNYSTDDFFVTQELLALRPETTPGSYAYARYLLENHLKIYPPICVWQHGKSFRREQDKTLKHMRLKEFYQLEFQCLFAPSTKADYHTALMTTTKDTLEFLVGDCRVEPSERLPHYSTETMDIIKVENNMEICSISRRTDYDGLNNIEVAIGTDRIIFNHKLNKEK